MGRTGSILVVVLALFVAGCRGGVEEYYPLEAGRSWSYRMTVRQGEAGGERLTHTTSVVTNLPKRPFAGATVVPQRQEAFGTARVRLLRDDGESVAEVGELNEADGTMVAKEPVNPIIRRPLTKEASWSATWETTQSGSPTSLPMRKTVKATDGEVDATAGTFEHCLGLALSGGGALVINGKPEVVRVTGEEWFAPAVGLVRAEFEETVPRRAEAATRIELELLDGRP